MLSGYTIYPLKILYSYIASSGVLGPPPPDEELDNSPQAGGAKLSDT